VLFLLLGIFGLVIILIFVGLWVVRWVSGKTGLIVFCAAAVGYLIYQIIDINVACSAEPEFIPPDCADEARCGIGTMVFPCDAPTGAIIYGVANILMPLIVIALTAFTVALVRQAPSKIISVPK
jgi:hypothetical protein